jgi:hypothetical protein
MSNLFPVPTLAKTEEDILLEVFGNPAVKKYLQVLSLNDLVELAEISAIQRSNEDIALMHATIRGKLSVLQTLLALAETSSNKEQQS